MLKFYCIFLFFCLFKLGIATIYRIFISNQASPPYLGTESSPFATLYSGFEYVVTQYASATSVDEFHFVLVAANSSQPFYLSDDEITNGDLLQGFQGKIIYKNPLFISFKAKFLLKVVSQVSFQ